MSDRLRSPSEDASELLKRLIKTGSLPSTVLITGPLGSGKRKLAYRCCAELLGDINGGAERGENADLGVFDFEDKPFKVEYARQLRAEAFKSPAVADMRVFVLMHVQNMTPEAQNALLKLLEEPPASVYFFLLCENESALLQTILSRCLKVHLSPPEIADAAEELRMRFPDAGEDEIEDALRFSGGYPEGAAARLEEERTEIGREMLELADEIIQAVMQDNEYELWKKLLYLEKPSRNDVAYLAQMLRRRLMLLIHKNPYDARYLKLDDIASQMLDLAQRNVNPVHILEILPQYFAKTKGYCFD